MPAASTPLISFENQLSPNALTVLKRRYLKKDAQGNPVETPQHMFHRVAKYVASADKLYGKTQSEISKTEEEFYSFMVNLEFMPNSPTLMNAGREIGQLSACFVLPVEDSMQSIFETLKNTAMIHKTGGGTGFSFSRLRPKNSQVQSTGGVASGPVSFMKVFDAATQAVKQGGTRRGANMGILRIDHPDILEFITCKQDDKAINNFNISVAITEDFMERVKNNEEYDLIEPHTNTAARKLKAKDVFDLIVEMAWKNGEPGIIFIDRINQTNPTPKMGQIESTNPCGEQPLLPYESCNLGSVNLSKMVTSGQLDWEKLKKTLRTAVHFLDNVIDVNKYPLKKIEEMTKANRKIGLGVMGFADMLIKLGVPYNADEAVELGEKIMSFILEQTRFTSAQLAKERGSFPNIKNSTYHLQNNSLKLRNATLTTIAPTGTISIISDCSSGIEPLFAISYYRQVMDNDKLVEVNPLFEEVARKNGFYSQNLMEKIAKAGSLRDIDEVPQEVKQVFVTSHDISPECHIKMQAAFQKYTDNAVSKTVNFPHEATIEDVRWAYQLAYQLGCKGVTIYRDRSRDEQVLNIAGKKEDTASKGEVKKLSPRPRPETIRGTTTKINTGCGSLYITINEDEQGRPFEIFTQMGKAGGCAGSQLEAIGRLVSLAFRSGIEVKPLINQLRGIRCPAPSWEKGGRIFSCADAIARALEKRLGSAATKSSNSSHSSPLQLLQDAQKEPPINIVKEKTTGNVVGVCPDCGGALRHEEGCVVCSACGYSKC